MGHLLLSRRETGSWTGLIWLGPAKGGG